MTDIQAWLTDFDERDWRTGTDGTLRVALVGLGWWSTDVVLPALAAADLCTVTALVSGSESKAERVAAANDVAHALDYEAYHDGAAADAYDAVYVGTPNAHHLPYAETAADLGKAVLCEKPLEASVERGERLVAACEDAGVPLMTAYRLHTHPAVRRARELVADGFLGDPVAVEGTFTQRLLEVIPDHDQWRLDPDVTGYGTSMMDVGVYPLNTARFLLRRDPSAVQARMDSSHEAFADVPDERAQALVTFEGDVTGTITASQHAQADSRLAVTGTEGRVELRPAFSGDATLHLARGEATAAVDHGGFDEERQMREEFAYFADRVLGDEPVYADGRHGLADLRAIAAMHEAAETGERVAVER
jgi:predicted dehydrogenase